MTSRRKDMAVGSCAAGLGSHRVDPSFAKAASIRSQHAIPPLH